MPSFNNISVQHYHWNEKYVFIGACSSFYWGPVLNLEIIKWKERVAWQRVGNPYVERPIGRISHAWDARTYGRTSVTAGQQEIWSTACEWGTVVDRSDSRLNPIAFLLRRHRPGPDNLRSDKLSILDLARCSRDILDCCRRPIAAIYWRINRGTVNLLSGLYITGCHVCDSKIGLFRLRCRSIFGGTLNLLGRSFFINHTVFGFINGFFYQIKSFLNHFYFIKVNHIFIL